MVPDVPVRFAETPAAIDRLPPRLGEHGREILQEIGMRPDEIDALAASGGVVLPSGKEKGGVMAGRCRRSGWASPGSSFRPGRNSARSTAPSPKPT